MMKVRFYLFQDFEAIQAQNKNVMMNKDVMITIFDN